jgi:glycosyltransferase involved in cell wall biosynthesis
MRVLIVNSMFANRLYRRAADELGAFDDIDLTMLTVDSWIMNGRNMPFEELAVGSPYKTVVGKAGWRGKENRGFYKSGIARAFRLAKPDVLFLMEEPFSVFALQILTLRAILAPHIPVVFFTWNNLSLEKFDYRPGFFYRTVARWALPKMQSALTANNDGHQVLRDAGFRGPIKTVGYGVDSAAYSEPRTSEAKTLRKRLNIDDDAIVIGYVGRMLEQKGLDLLVDAFANLRERTDKKLNLLLVGSGDEEQAILHQTQARGIADLVRHVPSVAHHEVPDYMHALDILVLPSRRRAMWAEQFGRVLVEAMAAGKMVIGSSSGAIPEVIGSAGFIFEENNAQSLLARLEEAIDLPDYDRDKLAPNARDRALNHFSWKRFATDAREAILTAFEGKKAHA